MQPNGETRFDVLSSDGTSLAVWVDGSGPPLVLVHGSLQDHTANRALVDELVGDFTTFAPDRRGFGASDDSTDWTLDQEFDDLAAVIDHVADSTGEPVAIWGHSFGANVAMGAASQVANVRGLVLYEPSLGLSFPVGAIEALATRIESGEGDGAVAQYLHEVLHLTDDEVTAIRSTPRWPTMIGAAHTIPRESEAERDWRYQGQFASITAPILMLTGSDTPHDLRQATHAAAAAIGCPEIRILDGHAHLAHRSDPALVAGVVREFLLAPHPRDGQAERATDKPAR
jgi:pimeloyl-ACP methyl ester carboxylesterase